MNRALDRSSALGFVLSTLILAACSDGPTSTSDDIDGLPRDLTQAEQDVITASNEFAFGLLREVNRDEAGKNVFISPLSASMALGMTMNGAEGPTFEAMQNTLGFAGLSRAEINQSYRDLIDLLQALDPVVTFEVGNSIWYRQGFQVLQEFLTTTSDFFDAEVAELDFNDPAAVTLINSWVSDATHGKIDKIVDSLDPVVLMLLINAIYFNGDWTYQFDPEETRDADFQREDGSTVPVRLMGQKLEFLYAATDGYQAVELPYGGGAFAMTVVLPGHGSSLDSLITALDPEGWDALLAGLAKTEMDVFLPRFELEYEKTLNDALGALGMGLALSPSADFSRMTPGGGVWIGNVKQKTFVAVDEEGTEAAAVTVVPIVTSAPPAFRADRPFLFAIRERFSGTILFIGKLADPTAA